MNFNLNKMILALVASVALLVNVIQANAEPAFKVISDNYANIAHAGYEDSLRMAEELLVAVEGFLQKPSKTSQDMAKEAWTMARVPYQQTEAFRFGNKLVDDWEGKVNAWPLDEGLIDYVSQGYGTKSEENPLYIANIIANKTLKVAGKDVDATNITGDVLESLQEAGGVEANVATGYHAIEFLLWGQDNNGTKAGAGTRPATDFDTAKCTGGNCDRRAAYLTAATKLLIKDLKDAVAMWTKDGKARAAVMANDGADGIKALLTGMGSLSYGELAGERIKLGLILHDPEEEHDCFSDNTHASHFNDGLGIRNVYVGSYKRVDGSVVKGASLADFMKSKDAKVNEGMISRLDATMIAMIAMVNRAKGGEAYDQMIAEGNKEGNAVVQKVVDALTAQTKDVERVLAVLKIKGVEIEGSDSLDSPSKVK